MFRKTFIQFQKILPYKTWGKFCTPALKLALIMVGKYGMSETITNSVSIFCFCKSSKAGTIFGQIKGKKRAILTEAI